MKFSKAALALVLSAFSPLTALGGKTKTVRRGSKANHRIAARRCQLDNNGEKRCAAEMDIDLWADDTIDFEVDGRTISFQQNKETSQKVQQWSGSNPSQNGDATIIEKENSDGTRMMHGSFVDTDGKQICNVGPDADGHEMVQCKPISQFRPYAEPQDTRSKRKLHAAPPSDHSLSMVPANEDETSIFDIMVVWTKRSECVRAGLEPECALSQTTEDGMRGLVDLAIEETNEAFEASGIKAQVRLVHAYREPSYVEANPADDEYGLVL